MVWRPCRAEQAQVTMFDRQPQQTTIVGAPGAFDSLALSPHETRICSADVTHIEVGGLR